MKTPGLNERERKFVERFMSSGNATAAAKAAGYSRKTASQIGYQLLRKLQIQRAIAGRVKACPLVATREERQAWWSAIMRGDAPYRRAAMKDRLYASQLLARSQGDFVEHHLIDVGESLYELLGGKPLPNIRKDK